MKGTLYGIGAGPGDPELLTLKAINRIKSCEVIALPKSGSEKSTVFSITERYLEGKELIECSFAMVLDQEKREEARNIVANNIIHFLEQGRDVGYVTLGDPTTYSTYMYVHEIIVGRGYHAEIIPGITSFAAAAASLGLALCEGDQALTIIPAHGKRDIKELLDCPGNKVIMKSGKHLGHILEKLKEEGLDKEVKIVSRVSMEAQRLYKSISEYENSPETGYFTLAIVKKEQQRALRVLLP